MNKIVKYNEDRLLRELRIDDAPFMLEWMHDSRIVDGLRGNFASKKIDSCIEFINTSLNDKSNIHMAIVDVDDEYLGTCSLKHVNVHLRIAEFGIAIRSKALGSGVASVAMKNLFEYSMDKLGITNHYWCVNPVNNRANRFYEKNKYRRIDLMNEKEVLEEAMRGGYSQEEILYFIWYRNP